MRALCPPEAADGQSEGGWGDCVWGGFSGSGCNPGPGTVIWQAEHWLGHEPVGQLFGDSPGGGGIGATAGQRQGREAVKN